ncbi:MAG TPA: hypothetical protein VKU93_09595 [Terracidiphilus sp.]|nr:hypothetical protein [Terracidiphilus sp.]
MHLDYLSCALTIVSTFLVGRRNWTGLVVAAANSLIVCDIGWKTSQIGLIPANVFCLGVYAFSVRAWIRDAARSEKPEFRLSLFPRIPANAPESGSQKAASDAEMQRPAQSRPAAAAAGRGPVPYSLRRRQLRSVIAWPRTGVYSRAAAR